MKKINAKIENYILPTGKLDIERLKILNDIYGKYSRNTFDKVDDIQDIKRNESYNIIIGSAINF